MRAAEREALQALIRSLESEQREAKKDFEDQSKEIQELKVALDDEEAARLIEAAAAAELRKRLKEADTELTAMTLTLLLTTINTSTTTKNIRVSSASTFSFFF